MNDHAGRYAILLKLQTKIWAVLLVVYFVIGAIAGLSQASSNHDTTVKIEQAQNRAHFWQVVAGNETSVSATVDNKLAKELHERLGPIDPNANSLSPDIIAFRGNSNAYGGITDTIKYDPFDEAGLNCFECGPLSRTTQDKLLQIKQGHVADVIAAETPAPPPGLTLTPFGMSVWQLLVLGWLMGGPLVLFGAHEWALTSDDRYQLRRFGDLNWSLNGQCDGTKLVIVTSAPTFFAPYLSYRLVTRRKFEARVRAQFPNEMRLLDQVDNAVARLGLHHGDDPKLLELEEVSRKVGSELHSLTRASVSDDYDLEHLIVRLRGDLAEVQDQLVARREAVTDLDRQDDMSWVNPPSQ